MGIYNKILESLNDIKNQIKRDPTTNNDVSSAIAGEIALISAVLIGAILLRHINITLTVVIIIVLAVLMITNMPLSLKLKSEQNDDLNKMIFYVILTLSILVTLLYWGFIK
ncbi:energy-converting hydrogenase B subunit G EhbG [Methanobrevibacter curvatus]|uniref:Hydrogenase subunit EhbG n=1 Tax=Methanobrevibacter curvatus TaxID=49547 RepID=A0A166C5C4_9EURY|nr:energy-converting hydrogenase B subunit G EhbG [Methanobrevibacter curvatus]KZX14145.1 hypothetical protein MBCUR_06210 [Methanobrevibacter curvatus]